MHLSNGTAPCVVQRADGQPLLVLSQCKTTSAYEEPRSSGNNCTNSFVVKITAHNTSLVIYTNKFNQYHTCRP